MKKILLTLSVVCFYLTALAQRPGLITGLVIDQEQGLSLPGATVKLRPGNRYTVSLQNGRFEFLNVPPGNYTVEVSYLGFEPLSNKVSLEENATVNVNLEMEPASLTGQTVLVMGDRLRGQARALNQQKNNPNVTSIISADQIGRFPDANIGDALKRVPGVAMQNDQGEARDIIVRGMAPELNSVTLNGDRIPSAEGDNRRVQMDLIPAEMIQTIEVNKTLTPDMDADAIGGSVNLVSRAAPNGPRVSATLSGGYNPIREKALYTGSFVFGNRFAGGKLGAVLSGSYNDNDYGSDNVEAEWAQDDHGNVYIQEHDVRKYDVRRVRRSLSVALDYQVDEKNALTLNAMYNWRDDWENRYRLRHRGIEPVYDANDNITGYTGDIRRQTKGGLGDSRIKNARLEDQRVQNYSLRGDHLLSSQVDLDWVVSYSRASEDRPHERYIEYQASDIGLSENMVNARFPEVVSSGAMQPEQYGFRELTENHDFTRENELGAKLNLRIPFSLVPGQKGRLRIGGRLRLKEKKRDNMFYEYESRNEGDFANLALVPEVNWGGEDFQPGAQFVPGGFADRHFLGGLPLQDASQFGEEAVPDEYLVENYKARETITAGYLRWDQDLSARLSLIAGLRLEHTSIDYRGNIIQDEEELEGEREIENDYLDILPGLTIKYEVNPDLILRAAATTSLARPNYYDLSPFVNTMPGDVEIEAGNPGLQAAYAWNFDLMGENYFQSVGLMSAGVFFKNINQFIYVLRDAQFTREHFAQRFSDLPNPIPDGENWTLTQSRNGDNVQMYGLEVALQRQLDFLPGFWKGFGVYLNYTFTRSKAEGVYNEDGEMRTGITLPGTAPHMFNASLSYETSRFIARVSGNFAAAYLDELGGNDFQDRYYDQQFFLDANASYRIAGKVRIFGEANNLTNQPLRYYQGIASRTMQVEYYRPRYNLGFKFDL